MKVMNNVYDMRLCVYQCFVVNMQAVYQACFLVVFFRGYIYNAAAMILSVFLCAL